jgi:hypothetical protein
MYQVEAEETSAPSDVMRLRQLEQETTRPNESVPERDPGINSMKDINARKW